MRNIKHLEKALQAVGYRITRQRKAILDYLACTDDHPSARQVYEQARKNYPTLSLATVYNTLDTLVHLGLIKVLDFQSMDNRHETNLSPHINLICTECGSVKDFEGTIDISAKAVKEKADFEVRDSRMEYYGVCAKCARKA